LKSEGGAKISPTDAAKKHRIRVGGSHATARAWRAGTLWEQAQLLDLAHDAIVVRGLADERIHFWNQGAEETYGYSRVEALGSVSGELLKTRYPVPVQEIEATLRTSGRWEGELVQSRKDGSEVVVVGRWATRGAGPDAEIVEVNRDITAGRRAQEMFRTIFERGPTGTALVDETLTIFESNQAFKDLFGLAPSRRPTIFDLSHPDDAELTRKAYAAVDEGVKRLVLETRFLRADGTDFWGRATLAAVRRPDSAAHFYIAMVEDTTEQKRVEAALREHGERMEALERSKSDFLNVASHELRGPITVIRGYVSMMQEGYFGELNETGRRVLPALLAKADAMGLLVEQILDAARLEDQRVEIHVARLDLRSEVEKVVSAFGVLASERHHIVLDVPLEEVPVTADPKFVETILGNVLDNAVKYSPAGGEVLCEVERSQEAASVSVSDRGIGISRRDMRRLFTRFGRVVNPETSDIGGTGLGLYLSREMARRLGGDLTAAPRAGGGSTFTLTLPIAN
jgi:PAS domain S-box-containing protein